MANLLLWDAELSSPTSYLTTELNSLANNAGYLGAEFTTSQKRYVNFELSLAAQGSARSAGARVELYLIPSIDGGSTYAYGASDLTPSANHFVRNFFFDAATNARVDIVEKIPIGAGRYKALIINKTGQAFANSGSTLKYNLMSEELQ